MKRTNLKKPKTKTILSFSIAFVASLGVILIGTLLYLGYSKEIKKTAMANTSEITSQVNNNLDFYITDIMNVASYAQNVARAGKELTRENVEEKLQTLIESRRDLTRIAIFDLVGNVMASTTPEITLESSEIIKQRWFTEAKNNEGTFFFTGPRKQNLTKNNDEIVLSYSSLLHFRDGQEDSKGILLINLNFNVLSEIIDKAVLPGSGYVYLINNFGRIVYHPFSASNDQEEDLKGVANTIFGTYISSFNGKDRITVIEPISQTSWRIVGVAMIEELMEPVRNFFYILVLSLITVLALTLVASNFVGLYVTRPIRKLEETMRKVQKGNFDVDIKHEGTIETVSLSRSFSITITKIKELMEDIKKSESIKRQRELEALQAKINPHFLYNTLDSMIWMAETGDKEGVVKMATSLANLFRISIAKGHDIITIKEELNHTENYLKIQAMRYKDKFSYSINLPENLDNVPTIKLIVQPIVENSIYHGIKYLQEKGSIDIFVRETTKKDIEIEVKDNGVGMTKETLSLLLSKERIDKNDDKNSSNGIALSNVDERIKLTYGEKYGLFIDSELDVGTTVRILIPKEKDIKAVVLKNS